MGSFGNFSKAAGKLIDPFGLINGGGGGRDTIGYTPEQEESLRRQREALRRLQGLVDGPGGINRIQDVFGISADEQRRRRELISTGATRTTEDVIDSIRAEAGRAGVLNAPGFVTGQIGQAASDIGFQRLGAEVTLDEAIRGGKQQALGFETNINQFLAGTSPEAQIGPPQVRQRSPTFGDIALPAMFGVAGQAAGAYFGSQAFGGGGGGGISSAFNTSGSTANVSPSGFGGRRDWFTMNPYGE